MFYEDIKPEATIGKLTVITNPRLGFVDCECTCGRIISRSVYILLNNPEVSNACLMCKAEEKEKKS